MTTVTVIGCGVIGAMLAYELSKDSRETDVQVRVLETNPEPAMVATGAA